MSIPIAESVPRLYQSKDDIAAAITEMGGIVNEGDGFEDFSSDVRSIPTGGAVDTTIIDSLIEGTLTHLENSTATVVGRNVFYYYPTLKSVALDSVARINANAFKNCTSLSSVNLPVCTYLDTECFSGCSSLKILDLPKVETITRAAFATSSLTTLIIRTDIVATLANTTAFNTTPIASGTGHIFVPDNLVEEYKSATNWSTYASQIKGLSELEAITE